MGQIAQKSRGARCDRRRDAIIQVARDIFLTEGYGAASMSTIAAAVGGSKGTLYAYFRSKAELFGAVLRSTTEDQGGGRVFPATPEPPCTDLAALSVRLTRIGQLLLAFMCRPQTVALYRLVIGEAGRFPELGETFYKAGPQDKIEHLSRLLGGAMAQGLLRADDPALAAGHFLSLCRARTHQHLLWGLAPEPSEAEIATDIDRAVQTFMAAYRV
jgi:AcrR family transcriptional regulator